MNEFIVWDEKKEEFIDEEYCILCNGTLYRNDRDFGLIRDYSSFFQYIGIKDINNKKIYADSSIVEFEYLNTILVGYFTYNKDRYRYEIITTNKTFSTAYNEFISNFKIIDNIQENKLKLI